MDFDEYVNNLKRKIITNRKDILFVCIGNNDILWDSIGPLVGNYLKNNIGQKNVLGDTENNICNIWDLIYYYPKIKNKYIVAIDTAISNKNLSGQIFISNKPIIMGKAINKNKGKIGDLSIKIGISDLEKINNQYVKSVARFVSDGIYKAYKKT